MDFFNYLPKLKSLEFFSDKLECFNFNGLAQKNITILRMIVPNFKCLNALETFLTENNLTKNLVQPQPDPNVKDTLRPYSPKKGNI